MKRTLLFMSSFAALLSMPVNAFAVPQQVVSCGGCFAPPEVFSPVESHRMAVALSPTKSILWDQIVYQGQPEDFVWVLPLPHPNVEVEVSDPTFFTLLETWTAPVIQAFQTPQPPCPGSFGGSGGLDAGASPDPGVDIFEEKVVGPYATVTIGAEDPNALVTWLRDNGYAVPDSTLPAIQYYTARESVFLVLRLAPDEDVSAMQPIRVEFPGYMPTFPLRMVTVGATARLALTLWIIADQRYQELNYGTERIDETELKWIIDEGRSNYEELFLRAVDKNRGAGWVVQAALAARHIFDFNTPTDDYQRIKELIPYPYVTRLASNVAVENVAEDLLLAPSVDNSDVENVLTIQLPAPPLRDCPKSGNNVGRALGCSAGAGTGGAALIFLAFAALARRRR